MKIFEEEMIKPKRWEKFLSDPYQIAFDSGHLTYSKENGKYFLKIPNQEIRMDFSTMINTFMIKNKTYDSMMEFLLEGNFKDFFDTLEKITFKNKSILNLKDRNEAAKDQANYEVFLHQACSIALKEMLLDSKKRERIMDFKFLNEIKPQG